jgi:hypothetical protein
MSSAEYEQLLTSLQQGELRVSMFGSVNLNHKESQNLYVAIGRRLAFVPEGALLTGANAAAFCEADPGKGNSAFHMKLRCMESCTCIADLLSK